MYVSRARSKIVPYISRTLLPSPCLICHAFTLFCERVESLLSNSFKTDYDTHNHTSMITGEIQRFEPKFPPFLGKCEQCARLQIAGQQTQWKGKTVTLTPQSNVIYHSLDINCHVWPSNEKSSHVLIIPPVFDVSCKISSTNVFAQTLPCGS